MKRSRDGDVSLDAASCSSQGPLSLLRNDIKALPVHPCSNFNLPKKEPLLDLTDQNLHFSHLLLARVVLTPSSSKTLARAAAPLLAFMCLRENLQPAIILHVARLAKKKPVSPQP